jgi:hypothetical protein
VTNLSRQQPYAAFSATAFSATAFSVAVFVAAAFAAAAVSGLVSAKTLVLWCFGAEKYVFRQTKSGRQARGGFVIGQGGE